MVRAMARSSSLVLCVALAACGPARTVPPDDPSTAQEPEVDCATLRARESEARAELDACRETSPSPEWAQRETFDWLETQIGARLDGARRGESMTATIVDMQQIAERVWALLDEIPEAQRDPALSARVEDASEQLIHPHEPEARVQALAELAGALGILRERLEPAPIADACRARATTAATAWMTLQATCPGTGSGS